MRRSRQSTSARSPTICLRGITPRDERRPLSLRRLDSPWSRLRDALLDHARSAPVVSVTDTAFGEKYILEGPFPAADGRTPRLRAVWFIAVGQVVPRFVTAYPRPGAR